MTAIDYDGLADRLRELDTHLEGEFWTIGNAATAIQTLRAELADRDAKLAEAVEALVDMAPEVADWDAVSLDTVHTLEAARAFLAKQE